VVTSSTGDAGKPQVAESVPLSPLTTLRIGPIARRVITCDTTEKVIDVIRSREADDALILAGGSNVVLADDMTDLTVVLLANTEITVEDNVVRAPSGGCDCWTAAAVRFAGCRPTHFTSVIGQVFSGTHRMRSCSRWSSPSTRMAVARRCATASWPVYSARDPATART
jgi:hypothetical protein